MLTAIANLPAGNLAAGHLNVIVETPQGSQNKFVFDPDLGLFKLSGVLPAGHSFPFDFGFVPSTKAEDGDPLDVLLLLDAPTSTGCLVEARLIGAIELEQTSDGKTVRNDRLLAVAEKSRLHRHVHDLKDLTSNLLQEIEHFFISYNQAHGHEVRILHQVGRTRAIQLVRKALQS